MRQLLATTTALVLAACASNAPSVDYPTESELGPIGQLHAAEDWSALGAYAARVLQEFDFERYPGADERLALWQMVEACEHIGDVETHAILLRCLASLADPDAPLALVDFVTAHGREPIERCGASQRREVVTWLAMAEDCRRGGWVAARQRIAADFPDEEGQPQQHAIASHVLLGDLLRRADRCEPALVEYTSAAFGRALAGDPLGLTAIRERTLGCVRIESLLFEMGEGDWALQAMKIVNRERDRLVAHPRSRALDEAVRAGARAEAELLDRLSGNFDNPTAPELPALAQDLAALSGFDPAQIEGQTVTWRAPGLGLTLVATDEVLRIESQLPSVGAYEVAWTTETWESGPKCVRYTEPQDSRGRCVRRFRDGSIYFGSSGFDSDGLLLCRDHEPYVGPGIFGRPRNEGVRVVGFLENEPVPGPHIDGLGERRAFVANVACGALLIGEGFVQGDTLVPDGVVRLAYSPDAWFRARSDLGVVAPWRRSGNVILRSDLSIVEDVDGMQVVWVDPEQWGARIERAEQLHAAAEREQFENQFREQMRVWASMGNDDGHGVPLESQTGVHPCYTCNGSGSVYGSGRWESFTYYEQSDPSDLPAPRTATRWVNGSRDNCPQCGGTGKQ